MTKKKTSLIAPIMGLIGLVVSVLYGLFLLVSPVVLPNDSAVCNLHIMHPGDTCHSSGGRTGNASDSDFDEQKASNMQTGAVILGAFSVVAAVSFGLYKLIKRRIRLDEESASGAPAQGALPNYVPAQHNYGPAGPGYFTHGRPPPRMYDVPPSRQPQADRRTW